MRLEITAKTNVKGKLSVDYIEVKLPGKEDTVSLNWDDSCSSCENGLFHGDYKGVCFDEEYANGRLNELAGMKVDAIGLYSEYRDDEDKDYKPEFELVEMSFSDGEELMDINDPSSLKCDDIDWTD